MYRASPARLKEDVSQEAEIAHDYRGRLVYELLQNADDAMLGQATQDDRIAFHMTDSDLWVGNTGRPLSESDVRGLCGTGASSKGDQVGPRRASIGHKGMGFKSVLEVTDHPAAYSLSNGFGMDGDRAREAVDSLFADIGRGSPPDVPVMRFPWPLTDEPDTWATMRQRGINTLFRFPLRADLTQDQRALLKDRLLSLPVTAILFLKHLERVEVSVEQANHRATMAWSIARQQWIGDAWQPCPGFAETGVYRVEIKSDQDERWTFVLAHDADITIGDHRGGLSGPAWAGIEFAEVSVATPWPGGGTQLPADWRRFHVFLPTGEPNPYQLLVSAAFASDLSRQEIRVSPDSDDYNQFLVGEAARLLVSALFPALEKDGAETADLLRIIDRGGSTFIGDAGVARTLLHAVRAQLAQLPLIPTEVDGLVPVIDVVVPPQLEGGAGKEFRSLLTASAAFDGKRFPRADLCVSEFARVLVDHGAVELAATSAARVLASADPERSSLGAHPTADLRVDPVLGALETIWRSLPRDGRADFESAVRREALLPIALAESGVVTRVSTDGVTCFYPPRSFSGNVPLPGLRFLLQDVAWGGLTPRERNLVLHDQLPAWQGLFDLREFKFPDVMRASVLPALELDPDPQAREVQAEMHSVDRLAAICQLAGRTPKIDSTLPYQRLGPDRALFNLARLPVPCRPAADGTTRWLPAYRVYFGTDWVGAGSVEAVVDAVTASGAGDGLPDIPLLAPPNVFQGYLDRYRSLEADDSWDADSADDEVSADEDDESALETSDRERWITFLTWIGVNHMLRPVHFHDVEDRGAGWLTTADLARPQGHAFRSLRVWDQYQTLVAAAVRKLDPAGSTVPYLYRAHVLEHFDPLARIAAKDESASVARALWTHLASNWTRLERFSRLQLALVPRDRVPSMRTKPPRPIDDELRDALDDLWLRQLKSRVIAPTSQGPRRPNATWLPSHEIERLFGHRDWPANHLVPILDAGEPLLRGKGREFAREAGVRDGMSPSSFQVADAQVVLRRLQMLFSATAEDGTLEEDILRQVIRPTYRHLFDLLTGDRDGAVDAPAPLGDAPLLATNGRGAFRFLEGRNTLFIDRHGARERMGIEDEVWTFALEAYPAARAPLTRLFASRALEDAVEWTPEPSEPSLSRADLSTFRRELTELAPFLLSRLRADRAEERRAQQDARLLKSFIARVEPVLDLRVGCFLDGSQIASMQSRDGFVRMGPEGDLLAYVRWGDHPWPPTRREAEALASSLTDLFKANFFESFLALTGAESTQSRLRVLHLAGASTDLLEAREALAEVDETGSTSDTTAGLPELPPSTEASEERRRRRHNKLRSIQMIRIATSPCTRLRSCGSRVKRSWSLAKTATADQKKAVPGSRRSTPPGPDGSTA